MVSSPTLGIDLQVLASILKGAADKNLKADLNFMGGAEQFFPIKKFFILFESFCLASTIIKSYRSLKIFTQSFKDFKKIFALSY